MNESAHAFEPDLVPIFSEQAYSSALKFPNNPRQLFYALNHINERFSWLAEVYVYLKNHLAEIKSEYQSHFSADCQPDAIEHIFKQPAANLPQNSLSQNELKICLIQTSPICLTELCWLQTISQAVTSQDPLAVALMSVYLRLNGGEPYKTLFKAHLMAAGINLPGLYTQHYAQQKTIAECMFDFAAIQLALAQFPRVFFAEILGFTLAYCQTDPLLQRFAAQQNNPVDYFTLRQSLLAAEIAAVEQIIKDYLKCFPDQTADCWQRIQTGYWLYHHQTERCYAGLKNYLEQPVSPGQALVELLQQKAPFAFGHHRKIQLDGKSLDDWFNEKPFAGEAFLTALKQSAYVDRQNPVNSPLPHLFEFNGPMFGVLNAAEKDILTNWLASEKKPALNQIVLNPPHNNVVLPGENGSTAKHYANLNNRTLFYYLLNVELYPEVLPLAKQKAQQILALSRRFNRLPFKAYRHSDFDAYINGIYQREVNAYRALKHQPKLSKQTYIWGIEQLAPSILTDGCWLQNVKQLSDPVLQPVCDRLFNIYCDELGAGVLKQNHPFIYQQLLESVNIYLPPLHSKAFIEYPGFLKSAFDIPVYLLAISKFPNAFLPELLGLNMAIELSGLGNGYLRLAEELKFWGINPAIVNVHISIDNLASGHAALAKTAIQLYLDYLAANHGNTIMHEHWRRVYTGYCSLATVSLRFKIALAIACFFHKRG